MESPKLKNIVLLILLVTNLFLLGFVGHRGLQNAWLEQQAREDAIRFLEERNVAVAQEQIPRSIALKPQTVTRDLEREGEAAQRLLGSPVEMEDRGGGVYRWYNEKGVLQFHSDGSFSGSFSEGAFPVGMDWEKDCLDILSRLGFEGELLSREGEQTVFRQRWEKRPLFNQQVTLEVQDGCLSGMTAGRRLVGEPQEDLSRETATVASALIRFRNGMDALSGVCSRVDQVTEGYVSGTSLSGLMTLTPAWHIATDTGTYQLDLVTGALSRVS